MGGRGSFPLYGVEPSPSHVSAAKGASGKGPCQKTSKATKKCQKYFRQFSRRATTVKNCQKVSKVFSTLFDNFLAAPVFRPLLGGSEYSVSIECHVNWSVFLRTGLVALRLTIAILQVPDQPWQPQVLDGWLRVCELRCLGARDSNQDPLANRIARIESRDLKKNLNI